MIAHLVSVDRAGRSRLQLRRGLVCDPYFFSFAGKEKAGTVDMTRANPAALAIVCRASQSMVAWNG